MNMKRMRGRNHRPNGGGGGGGGGFSRNQQNGIPLNRNHVFDSSGPEMRVRGTAQQLYEKYTQMARDAQSNGDRVTGEACFQHAEHYFRIISAINQAQGQPPQGAQQNGQQGQERGNYQPQPYGERGAYQNNPNNQGEPRRDYNGGDQAEAEPRQAEPRQYEPRQQEPRQQEVRQQEPRRFEPRLPRPEFVRHERPRPAPVVDAPIDISSALEAELAAAVGEPAGLGDQPTLPIAAPEPRAIPIIPDAPPAVAEAPVRTPRPRGRPPRVAKVPAPADEPG